MVSRKLTLAKGIPLGKFLSKKERDFENRTNSPLLLSREGACLPVGKLGDEFEHLHHNFHTPSINRE